MVDRLLLSLVAVMLNKLFLIFVCLQTCFFLPRRNYSFNPHNSIVSMLKNQLIVISVTFYLGTIQNVEILSVACCSSVHPEFILSAYDKSHSILYQYTSCEFSSDSRNPDRDSILCIPSIHLGLETIYKKYSSIRLTKLSFSLSLTYRYRRKFNEEDDKRFIPNKYEYSSFQHSGTELARCYYIESQLRIANSKSIGSIDKNSFKSFITLSLKGDKGNCSLEQSVIFVFNK